ncbi:PAS domain-containing protein [Bdellovibrio reynosensis]|uniref:PAS domain-containing protein n=1 Tax=Bdellovibrio reynosensis TaxID=2835041 RepID=A0ABY4CCR7_9BACT|nr:PAS domain-containing protein [Bdellovibrio reynosensis]UOF02514.1 PAS domain-containing protein [Bdellovibrio reynosensis]
MINKEGRILTWNEPATELFGYESKDILGKDEGILFVKSVSGTLEYPSYDSQGWRLREDATFFWAQENSYPILGKNGEIEFYLKVVHDISEERILEQNLKKWIATYEKADWGVCISPGMSMLMGEMNPKYASMHGYTVEEMKGMHVKDFVAPEAAAIAAQHTQMIWSKSHHIFECLHIRKDGSRFPVLVEVGVVRDDNHNPTYCVVHARDISNLKHSLK